MAPVWKWSVAVSLVICIYFRFRRHSGHDRTCCLLDPVAFDPERTSQTACSITSSARARIDCGTVRPSVLAVFMLTTSLNAVGCTKSAGQIRKAGMDCAHANRRSREAASKSPFSS